MKRTDNRSHCPVNYALEVIGDSWSFLIVRDIVFWGKHTYGEFLHSPEHIATNVLASRLAHLEDREILVKQPHPTDKRKETYGLTERGLDLIPALLELSGWSATHDPLTVASQDFVARAYADRDGIFNLVRETVKAGGSIFTGPGSVTSKLKLA
jgi:DNA-binding HxlR family transcriptional regulator